MDPLTPPPAVAQPDTVAARVGRWSGYIREAAARFGVPQTWIAWVMSAESGGRTHLDGGPITSRAGAMGLMQLMPQTYAAMASAHGLGADPYDPRDNILAGAAYLAAMRERFGYPGLFAAYNAGPARYADHLRNGTPLPAETRAYVQGLARAAGKAAEAPESRPVAGLFFALSGGPDLDPPPVLDLPARSEAGGK